MKKTRITPTQLKSYQATLRKAERAPGTIEKYQRDIAEFCTWLGSVPPSGEAAAAWKQALLQKGLKPATINSKLTALNGFFRFLGREDCLVRLLRLQRRPFRDQNRELTRADYQKLLAAAQQQGKPRLRLLLETICATGVRVSELQYITVEAAARGSAEVTLKGKIRVILLPGKLCRRLQQYAQKQKIVSGEIFLTGNGKSISRKQIWAEMKALCRQAGVQASRVFPHNLRHLFATEFYRVCKDIVKLADVLGHSNIETTRIYLVTTGAEHARQLERLRLVV